ncbi:MAG TPA: RsmD family RNA methyltransferase [Verrucomicrobiae bacterium]|nr:RsmD family RNA methyltransferase [Verrucomicrobiae bacterium]
MRIIAGLAKGMPVAAPRRGVRPTADRTRAAIFSILGGCVAEARVLDLFAGTGALGLEAASRGAASVTFVENAAGALLCLKRNLDAFQHYREAEGGFAVIRDNVDRQLRRLADAGESFSLVFADPPYGEAAQELLRDECLPRLLPADGLLVLESAKRAAPSVGPPWQLVREAVYGDTRVSLLRCRLATSTDGG